MKIPSFFGGCCFFLNILAGRRSSGSWSYTYLRTSSDWAVAHVSLEVLAARGRLCWPGLFGSAMFGQLEAGVQVFAVEPAGLVCVGREGVASHRPHLP